MVTRTPRSDLSRERSAGFTLVEMMIVAAILGILAAIAIPTFVGYVRGSKTSEATSQLGTLYRSSAALYVQHNADARAVNATVVTNCITGNAPRMPADPTQNKQKFVSQGGFAQMPHNISDYVYYGYSITSVAGDNAALTCGYPAGTAELYTFAAEGDLDGDDILSRFELAVGSDASDALYHARGIHIVNEHE